MNNKTIYITGFAIVFIMCLGIFVFTMENGEDPTTLVEELQRSMELFPG
jgi:hypothetical protein